MQYDHVPRAPVPGGHDPEDHRFAEGRPVPGHGLTGLGKTVITLTAIEELIYDRFEVRRVLIIAPKKVAEATWQAEAEKWDHLKPLRISTAVGTAKERTRAIEADSDVVVINRENVEWLCETWSGSALSAPAGHLPQRGRQERGGAVNGGRGAGASDRAWPFDMVVVDESSSFKNPSAKRFRALKRMLPRIKRMVILTGTPAPNGLEDLWAQIYLLDQGERLGHYITHYRARYFDHNPWRYEYTPKEGAFETVQAKISDLCVSMKAADYLQLPEMIVHDVPVRLDEKARAQYRKLEKDMLLSVPDDPRDITAFSAGALTGKLLQLCGGSVYDADGSAHLFHRAKLDALGELIEGLHGESCLIFYGFRHELPGIEDVLNRQGLRARRLEGAEDAADWNAGRIDALLAHPASCAYGLNLQQGGRHVIWYTLSWSLELYQQANARLYRQGQEKPVVIHRLITQGGMDEDVAKALEGKTGVQDKLIAALRVRRGSLGTG